MALDVIVGTVNGTVAILITSPKDEETIVVNRAEVRGDRIVYDVRPASTQQIRRIEAEKANAVPMESSSEEFLRDLIDHLAGPMKARLASFLPLPTK